MERVMILEHVEVPIDGTDDVVTYDVTVELAQQAAEFMRTWMRATDSWEQDKAQFAIVELSKQLGDHGPIGAAPVVLREVVRLKIFAEAERAEFDAALARGSEALDEGYEAQQRAVLAKLKQAVQAFLETGDAQKWIDDFCGLCLEYYPGVVGSSDVSAFMSFADEGLAWKDRDRLIRAYPADRVLVGLIHAKQRAEERRLGLPPAGPSCSESSCRCATCVGVGCLD